MQNILAHDIGFGDNKMVFGDISGTIELIDKFPSTIAQVSTSNIVEDTKLVGGCYYVGENALKVQSDSIIDISSYKQLEFYAPIYIEHALKQVPVMPDCYVGGLSIAHVEQSGYYKEVIEKTLAKFNLNIPVKIFPQGAIASKMIQKYGFNYPTMTNQLMDSANYVGADIGMGTLDIFQVINGSPSSNLIRGLENSGIIVICKHIKEVLLKNYSMNITIPEAKEALDRGNIRLRGSVINLDSLIKDAKAQYIKWLGDLIESKFGKILDKMDFIAMFGGGSAIFTEYNDAGFYRRAMKRPEYYNVISYYLKAIELQQSGRLS